MKKDEQTLLIVAAVGAGAYFWFKNKNTPGAAAVTPIGPVATVPKQLPPATTTTTTITKNPTAVTKATAIADFVKTVDLKHLTTTPFAGICPACQVSGVGTVETLNVPEPNVRNLLQSLVTPATKKATATKTNPVAKPTSTAPAKKPTVKAAVSEVMKAFKFKTPYQGHNYNCCCTKGALIAGLILG